MGATRAWPTHITTLSFPLSYPCFSLTMKNVFMSVSQLYLILACSKQTQKSQVFTNPDTPILPCRGELLKHMVWNIPLSQAYFLSPTTERRHTEHPFCTMSGWAEAGHELPPASEWRGGEEWGADLTAPGLLCQELQKWAWKLFRPAETLPLFTDSPEIATESFFFSSLL